MITNQHQLDRKGFASSRREGKAPFSGQPPKHGKGRRLSREELSKRSNKVMQREADERQDARDYQNALLYREEEYTDSSRWISRPAPVEQGTKITKDRLRIAVDQKKARLARISAIKRTAGKSRINPAFAEAIKNLLLIKKGASDV